LRANISGIRDLSHQAGAKFPEESRQASEAMARLAATLQQQARPLRTLKFSLFRTEFLY